MRSRAVTGWFAQACLESSCAIGAELCGVGGFPASLPAKSKTSLAWVENEDLVNLIYAHIAECKPELTQEEDREAADNHLDALQNSQRAKPGQGNHIRATSWTHFHTSHPAREGGPIANKPPPGAQHRQGLRSKEIAELTGLRGIVIGKPNLAQVLPPPPPVRDS